MQIKKFLKGLFVACFLFGIQEVLASTRNDTFQSAFIKEYGYVESREHFGNFQHFTRVGDGSTAYCIEPGVSLSTGVYDGFYDLSLEEKSKSCFVIKRTIGTGFFDCSIWMGIIKGIMVMIGL